VGIRGPRFRGRAISCPFEPDAAGVDQHEENGSDTSVPDHTVTPTPQQARSFPAREHVPANEGLSREVAPQWAIRARWTNDENAPDMMGGGECTQGVATVLANGFEGHPYGISGKTRDPGESLGPLPVHHVRLAASPIQQVRPHDADLLAPFPPSPGINAGMGRSLMRSHHL